MIALLLVKDALFSPGDECVSPVAPSDFGRLISGYRLTQTALLGDPYCIVNIYLVSFLLWIVWTSCGHRCRPLYPPGTCLRFSLSEGSSFPPLVGFDLFASPCSRAFRGSICSHEKVYYEYEHALWGDRIIEIDLVSNED